MTDQHSLAEPGPCSSPAGPASSGPRCAGGSRRSVTGWSSTITFHAAAVSNFRRVFLSWKATSATPLGFSDTVSAWKPDWVVHLAAMHFIPDCIAHPQDTIDVNVEVRGACSRAAAAPRCEPSSLRPRRPCMRRRILPTWKARARSARSRLYGESKLAGEQLATDFHHQIGTPTVILRLFNGIGRHETNPHVVPHIFESLKDSDVIRLGNLAPRRDYIDTRDIAEAIIATVENASGLGLFNVGTGAACSVRNMVHRLERILGRPITVLEDPARMRTSERMMLVADIGRIRRATKWAPRFSLDDTLTDMVAEYGLQIQPHSA